MKKLVVYLCLGVMVFSLTACGGGEQNNASTESTVESSVESTGEATQEGTQQDGGATDNGAQDGGSAEGNLDVSQGWSEEMTAVKAAIVESIGENYFPNMPLDPEMLEMNFGISSDMYDDYLAEMPMISTNVDTLLIIKAKNDKVEAVEEALNTYRDAKVSDTMQYPMNVGKIQASRIERIGDYVCFVQLGGDTMTAAESGDEAVIEQCQQANELAIEIISQNVEH